MASTARTLCNILPASEHRGLAASCDEEGEPWSILPVTPRYGRNEGPTRAGLGIDQVQSYQWRRLAAIPQEDFAALKQSSLKHQNLPRRAGSRRPTRRKTHGHQRNARCEKFRPGCYSPLLSMASSACWRLAVMSILRTAW
jgi:hypothetical protein